MASSSSTYEPPAADGSQVLLKVSVELSEDKVETLYVSENTIRNPNGIRLL